MKVLFAICQHRLRQQDLTRNHPLLGECLAVSLHEPALSYRSRNLQARDIGGSRSEAELSEPCGNRSGRDEDRGVPRAPAVGHLPGDPFDRLVVDMEPVRGE